MGGTDDPSNIIELSVEDHAKAHLDLYEKYGTEYDRIAYESLMKRLPKEEIVRQVCRATHLGKPKNPEAVEKMRQTKLGTTQTLESNKKRSETLKRKFQEGTFKPGVSHDTKTEEHNKKNSEGCKKSWDEGKRKEYTPGPTTEEGKKKCSERAKERWRQYRISKGLDPDTPMKKER
jgi:hypothetical protein